MTEEKFTELVNLYLDKEISEYGLTQLKSELAANAERKADFAERCRIYQATSMALNPQAHKHSDNFWRNISNKSSRSLRSKQLSQRIFSCTSHRADFFLSSESSINNCSQKVTTFSRWIMGTGLVACLALGFALLTPVFRDTSGVSMQRVIKGVEMEDLFEVDLLNRIGHREFRRFANAQAQRMANQQTSLAAQHWLIGPNPELTPKEKQLRPMNLVVDQHREFVRDHAELLAEVQKISAMPPPHILRVESMQPESAARSSGGFQSSLARFK